MTTTAAIGDHLGLLDKERIMIPVTGVDLTDISGFLFQFCYTPAK
jgi:hypothetical protein